MIPALIGAVAGLAGTAIAASASASRQDDAQAHSDQAAAIQYERQKEAATTAWEREQQGATTAYERSLAAQKIAWEQEKEGAATQYGRSQEAAAEAWARSQKAAEIQNQRAMEAADLAYQRSVQSYRRRYQWAVEDMKRAGLNPILAASGGFQVGSGVNAPMSIPQMAGVQMASAQAARGQNAQVPMASARSANPQMANTMMHNFPVIDLAGSAKDVSQAFLAEKQMDETEAKTEKVIQESKLVSKQTLNEVEKILETRAKKGLYVAKERECVQKIFNLEAEYYKTVKETKKLLEDTQTSRLTNLEKQKNLKLLEIKFEEMRETTKKLTYENRRLEQYSQAYTGKLGPALGYIKAVTDAIGINFGMFLGPKIGK